MNDLKGNLLRKALNAVTVMAMIFQLIPTSGVYALEEPDNNTVTEFKMVDDIKASDQQGYNGWHYMYKTGTGYADMTTRTSDDGGKWSEGDNWVNFSRLSRHGKEQRLSAGRHRIWEPSH